MKDHNLGVIIPSEDEYEENERETEAFVHIFILFFYFFLLVLIFILRIRVVDLSCSIVLGSLYIKFHCCLNLNGD